MHANIYLKQAVRSISHEKPPSLRRQELCVYEHFSKQLTATDLLCSKKLPVVLWLAAIAFSGTAATFHLSQFILASRPHCISSNSRESQLYDKKLQREDSEVEDAVNVSQDGLVNPEVSDLSASVFSVLTIVHCSPCRY